MFLIYDFEREREKRQLMLRRSVVYNHSYPFFPPIFESRLLHFSPKNTGNCHKAATAAKTAAEEM